MTEVAIKHAELPLDTITVQFADGDKLKMSDLVDMFFDECEKREAMRKAINQIFSELKS